MVLTIWVKRVTNRMNRLSWWKDRKLRERSCFMVDSDRGRLASESSMSSTFSNNMMGLRLSRFFSLLCYLSNRSTFHHELSKEIKSFYNCRCQQHASAHNRRRWQFWKGVVQSQRSRWMVPSGSRWRRQLSRRHPVYIFGKSTYFYFSNVSEMTIDARIYNVPIQKIKGASSYPLPSRSGFWYWKADVRLERTGQKLSHQGKGAQSETNLIHRWASLPGRHVGLSRWHLHRAQPLL